MIIEKYRAENTRLSKSYIGTHTIYTTFAMALLLGGMPVYKYIANRILTLTQNILMNQKLSEYHTGYRAYKREVLQKIPFMKNSDDFIFDNETVAQIFFNGFEIAEVTCPTKYFEEASSINFSRSVKYGLGVLKVSLLYFFSRSGIYKWKKLKHD